jgi:hypothetical protein
MEEEMRRAATSFIILMLLATQAVAQEGADEAGEAEAAEVATEYVLESGEVLAVRGEERRKIETPAPAGYGDDGFPGPSRRGIPARSRRRPRSRGRSVDPCAKNTISSFIGAGWARRSSNTIATS